MSMKSQMLRRQRGPTVLESLHGGVATDTVQAANALIRGIASVDFGEYNGGSGCLKSLASGVPSGFHVLAVAAPER